LKISLKCDDFLTKVSAKVPGGVYSDLLNAEILTSDPYYRFNDQEYLWVAQENWTYVANVELDIQSLKDKEAVMLECLGKKLFAR